MSDIPYSVRGSVTSVNKLRGFNFDTIEDNEMFKKVDANNVGGTKLISSATPDSNLLRMIVDNGVVKAVPGFIEAQTIGGIQKLHLNNTGDKEDGITITSNKRVGIGITDPDENLEVDGSIQIDSADTARLKFQQTGMSPHALGEIDGEQDGGNGGDLQFYTKVDGVSSVTEKLRINNIGAFGIGGANYGDVGAVLTSNGADTSVSWNRPYFMKAKLTTNITFTNGHLLGMTETAWGAAFGGATGDWSNDEWTCPQTGIYRITLQVEFISTSDNITFAIGFLRKNDAAVILRSENYYGNNGNDTLIRATVNATSILEIAETDTIRLDHGVAVNGGSISDVSVKGVTSDGDATFLVIERVL